MVRLLYPLFLVLYYIVSCTRYIIEVIQRRHNNKSAARVNVNPEEIQNNIATLKQVPLHIGVVVDSKGIKNSYSDLVHLLTWCIACRIKTITVHDHEGILKQNIEMLRKEVQIRNDSFFGSTKKIPKIKFLPSPKENVENKEILSLSKAKILCGTSMSCTGGSACTAVRGDMGGGANGDAGRGVDADTYVPCMCVTSAEDGRDAIIIGVQKIAEAVKNGNLDPKEIHSYEFMNQVISSYDPPDFILKFGDSTVWNGFLPWQIRYSEILYMGNLKNLQFDNFWVAMKTFDNCSRRFGK